MHHGPSTAMSFEAFSATILWAQSAPSGSRPHRAVRTFSSTHVWILILRGSECSDKESNCAVCFTRKFPVCFRIGNKHENMQYFKTKWFADGDHNVSNLLHRSSVSFFQSNRGARQHWPEKITAFSMPFFFPPSIPVKLLPCSPQNMPAASNRRVTQAQFQKRREKIQLLVWSSVIRIFQRHHKGLQGLNTNLNMQREACKRHTTLDM